MSHLTDEEVALLDQLTKKLTAPVSNAFPQSTESTQNQAGIKESKPAIEAVDLGEGAASSSVNGNA